MSMQTKIDDSIIFNRNLTPAMCDFFYALAKVSNLDNVKDVKIFFGNGKDCINIYVVVDEETLELNDKIYKYFVDWQEDHMAFVETHILTPDEVHYIPKEAYKIK